MPIDPFEAQPLPGDEVPDSAILPAHDAQLASQALEGRAGFLRSMVRVFAENKLAVASLAMLIFIVLFCFLGPFLYSTNQTNANDAILNSVQNAPPSWSHPLGTDDSGFDVLGRIMYGGQIALIVGFFSAIVATIIGVAYGALSGFFGGWFDALCRYRALDPGLVPPDRVGGHLPADRTPLDLRDRCRLVARPSPADPRRDPLAADSRVRPSGPNLRRESPTHHRPPHRSQLGGHHRRVRHL